MTALDGRVAVVTGGAQGIGRALAHGLGEAGAAVVVADKAGDRAAAVAESLRASGCKATAAAVDVTDQESVRAMVGSTVQTFGRVDVLVNNAAIFSTIKMGPFEDIPIAEWNQVLDVNLTGAFLCCQAVAGQMREQQYGRIINISSATVLEGRPNYLHYVTSKAGLVGLTRSLARELGSSNITVNAVMPGSVVTEIPRGTVTPEQAAAIIAAQSVPRRLSPADIVGPILFLSGDGAAAITGQTVVVDGGGRFV